MPLPISLLSSMSMSSGVRRRRRRPHIKMSISAESYRVCVCVSSPLPPKEKLFCWTDTWEKSIRGFKSRSSLWVDVFKFGFWLWQNVKASAEVADIVTAIIRGMIARTALFCVWRMALGTFLSFTYDELGGLVVVPSPTPLCERSPLGLELWVRLWHWPEPTSKIFWNSLSGGRECLSLSTLRSAWTEAWHSILIGSQLSTSRSLVTVVSCNPLMTLTSW